MGYRALKIDPFGSGSYEMTENEKQRSVEIIAAVREAIGQEAELFIEMHGRFAAHTAIDLCRRLAPYRPGWFEEPVPPENVHALAEVRRAVASLGIPVAAGERLFTRYLFLDVFKERAVDIIQPDVCHAGGLAETRKIAAMIAGTERALAATADGEVVALTGFTGGAEQLWRIDQLTDGTYRVMPKAAPNSKGPLALSAIGSSKPTLAAFNAASDRQRWLFKAP